MQDDQMTPEQFTSALADQRPAPRDPADVVGDLINASHHLASLLTGGSLSLADAALRLEPYGPNVDPHPVTFVLMSNHAAAFLRALAAADQLQSTGGARSALGGVMTHREQYGPRRREVE